MTDFSGYRPEYILDIAESTILVRPNDRILYPKTERLSILKIWLDYELRSTYYILDSDSKTIQPEMVKVKYSEFIDWVRAIRPELW